MITQLVRRVLGPYRVLSVQLHKVPIEEYGIPNTVSIDSILLSPTREQVTSKPNKKKHTMRTQRKTRQQQSTVKDAKKATKTCTPVAHEYMVSRAMRHEDTSQGRWYVAGV